MTFEHDLVESGEGLPVVAIAPPKVGRAATLLLWLRALPALCKLRVVALLLFAATGGALLGAGGWPGLGRMLVLLVTGGLAASGASALNQYLEQETDARMTRTRRRPLVMGAIPQPDRVPYLAGAMILVPSLAVLPFNPALTFFLLLGAAIYLGVYTLWLKPRTLLNIVIGGAAGSAAVLSGSAAVGAWNEPGAVALALLVFLWTPTHFWSLAIVYRHDYARGGFPMLPLQTSPRAAAFWVALHSGATALAALVLAGHPTLGWLYLIPVAAASADLLVRNARLLRHPNGREALSLFKASNFYLALILLMIWVDTLLG
ncbi:MAG: protoheme IX farnesyltransferase [Chloroflexi bacterium]|nr:MAG: protoheme IX farnesyltransferase [Chloroflexota bacterium]